MEQKVLCASLNTPALLLDMDKLEANIREMSQVAKEAGVKLRPHIKIHESTEIAKMQIEAGASGIEVGPIEQGEVFAEEGFNDIVVVHPFYGNHKLEILKKLVSKPNLSIAVVVDMIEQAEGISQIGQAVGRKIPVILKIEAGGMIRYGVRPGRPALNLAKMICQLPGVEFEGIYTHEMPTPKPTAYKVASNMAETARMLKREGIKIEHVSVGASATFHATCSYIKEGKFPEITEVHPGSCVIGDMLYVTFSAITEERCALTVLTSVMSTSHSTHAVLDAGHKTFGADCLIMNRKVPGYYWKGNPKYGSIRGRPDLWLGFIGAESSVIYYMDPKKPLSLGERLEIVPNNATNIINMHDCLYGLRNGFVERKIPVTGRGRGF